MTQSDWDQMGIQGEMRFDRVSTALRAPRVALLITEEEWQKQAHWALEILSSIWGGSGGVIIPIREDGTVEPHLLSALQMFDPDYLAPLHLSGLQYEEIRPGELQLVDDGKKIVAPNRRIAFLEKLALDSPQEISLVSEASLETLESQIGIFRGEDVERRLFLGTNSQIVSPLSPSPNSSAPVHGFTGTTGLTLLDLALASKAGKAKQIDIQIDMKTLALHTLWQELFKDRKLETRNTPFKITEGQLEWISYGYKSQHESTIVIGDSASDFALYLILDRLYSDVVWLPSKLNRKLHREMAATTLSTRLLGNHRPLNVFSISQSQNEVSTLLGKLWDRRIARSISDAPLSFVFQEVSQVIGLAHSTLCVDGTFDRRKGIPVSESSTGAIEMLSPLPMELSPQLEESDLNWIVEVRHMQRTLPVGSNLESSLILASEQNPFETFVRASRGSIAYEKNRWDLVRLGSSVDGRNAKPLLRWPSMQEILQSAAKKKGFDVRLSDSGRRTSTLVRLWGSTQKLIADLEGTSRSLLACFVTKKQSNGPYRHGIYIDGRCFVNFAKLLGSQTGWTREQLREWLDSKCAGGVMRRGLLLGCEICSAVDFFPISEIGEQNICKRCGEQNALSQPRWRDPYDEPEWYYSLHPSAVTFLSLHGDLPLLAWHRYSKASARANNPWYEFEIVGPDGKAIVELDFVGIDNVRLVVGEAKFGNNLDGANQSERERDAAKLVKGAQLVGAHEICLASSTSWKSSMKGAMKRATESIPDGIIRLSQIEQLTDAHSKPVVFS